MRKWVTNLVNDTQKERITIQRKWDGRNYYQPYEEGKVIIFDCYESYVDTNINGQYDLEDEFIDCGADGLCPEDETYIESDQGELDGICNRYIQYIPNIGFEGEDIITNGYNVEELVEAGYNYEICKETINRIAKIAPKKIF